MVFIEGKFQNENLVYWPDKEAVSWLKLAQRVLVIKGGIVYGEETRYLIYYTMRS